MESELKTYQVKDLIGDGFLFIGDGYRAKNSELASAGLPFARAGDINNGFHFGSGDCLPTEDAYKAGNKISEAGDVVFTSKGTVGRFGFVRSDIQQFVYSPQLCFWRSLKDDLISPSFLYYWVQGREFYRQYKSVSQKTDMAEYVSLSDQRAMEITLPSILNQREVAHILGTLDEKIELNRKTNETLEGVAKALFKSWFMDFDPVRAKAEGRPTGLPDEINELFPDSFEESELGEIPSGWSVQRLDDLLELPYGKALKETDRIPGPFPVFGSNGEVGFHNEALVKGPGIIVGRKGNPGIVKWSDKDFFPIDTTFYVKPKMEDLRLSFLFYALSNQRLPSLSADSAVPGLNRNIAYMNQQVLPPFNIVLVFDQMVSTIFERMSCLSSEEETLSSLRDALLPKLISGELRVPDAVKMIGEVGV